MTEYSPARTGEYPRIFPNFQNCARCEKDLKGYKDNSLQLGREYARIFVIEHYLFLVAHSFSLLGTDNVRGQISEHIFTPNGDYCLYIPQFSKLHLLRKNIWKIVNTIASIWRENNILEYLSSDFICLSKLTVFLELCSPETVRF